MCELEFRKMIEMVKLFSDEMEMGMVEKQRLQGCVFVPICNCKTASLFEKRLHLCLKREAFLLNLLSAYFSSSSFPFQSVVLLHFLKLLKLFILSMFLSISCCVNCSDFS